MITGRTEETLEKTAKEMKQKGGSVAYFQMDVRNPEDADQMVKFAVDTFGDVDALINNAKRKLLVPAEKLSPNGWKAVIDIVLNGTFFCGHAVGNYWIRQKKRGSMINMVATYAWGAGVGVAHSAAKAGVLSLTRTLAVEWGKQYRIRVNAIAPGPIERTGGADKLWESEEAKAKNIR